MFLGFCNSYKSEDQLTTPILIYPFFCQFTSLMYDLYFFYFISHLMSIYEFYVILLRFFISSNYEDQFATLTLICPFFHQFISPMCGL